MMIDKKTDKDKIIEENPIHYNIKMRKLLFT